MTDYPSVIRKIAALKAAPHGQRRARERALVRVRTMTMKRELARQGLAESRTHRSAQ